LHNLAFAIDKAPLPSAGCPSWEFVAFVAEDTGLCITAAPRATQLRGNARGDRSVDFADIIVIVLALSAVDGIAALIFQDDVAGGVC
jgi:hypothetical protein